LWDLTHTGKVSHLLPDRHLSELVQNFLPGTAERHNLGKDKGTRKKKNRLIYKAFVLIKKTNPRSKIYKLQITVKAVILFS